MNLFIPSVGNQLKAVPKPHVGLNSLILILICFAFSSTCISAQAQKFDPNGLVVEKMQEIKSLKKDDVLKVSKQERIYISTNIEEIKSSINEVKKSITKAKVLEREDELAKLEVRLEDLRALRKSYTMILHKASADL